MWENNWSKKTSYEEWITEVIHHTEQHKNFFYNDMVVDKYAGSVFTTDETLNLEWHGHEISRDDLKLTTTKTKASLPDNLKQISFVYQVEKFQTRDGYEDTVIYRNEPTYCDGREFVNGRVYVYTGADQGYFVCLENQYYRVIELNFIGDTTLTIGSSEGKTDQSATFVYDIPENHNFLGFTSYYEQILMKDFYNAGSNQGTNQQRWINLVSWFDLVTFDTVCFRKRFCPTVPDLRVDTFNSGCDKVALSWNQPAGSADTTYTIEYGPNYQYKKTVLAKDGSATITDNVVTGFMNFRLNIGGSIDPVCSTQASAVTYNVPSCLPTAPQNVLLSTRGVCPSTDEQVTVTWTPPSTTGGLPITGYEVLLSHNQFGTYTNVNKFCGAQNSNNWYGSQSCSIAFTTLANNKFSVGQPIYAKVVAVNAKGRAESLPSMAVTVSDGPNPVSYLEAMPSAEFNYGIVVRWFYINYMNFYSGSTTSSTASHTFTIRGKRQGDSNMVIIKDRVTPEQTVTGQVYTIPKTGSPLGTLTCGSTYVFEVIVEQSGSSQCVSTGNPQRAVVYTFQPGAPTCVSTANEVKDGKDFFKISWTAPVAASELSCDVNNLQYNLRILDIANVEQDVLPYCSNSETVNKDKFCYVSVDDLRKAPFSLVDGSEVHAKVWANSGNSGQGKVAESSGNTSCNTKEKIQGCPSKPLEVLARFNAEYNPKDTDPTQV